MKILYLQKQAFDATTQKIMDVHKKGNDLTIVNIKENKNYDQIVDLIFTSDKVISW